MPAIALIILAVGGAAGAYELLSKSGDAANTVAAGVQAGIADAENKVASGFEIGLGIVALGAGVALILHAKK
ncbi:MAG TPA: hypothetical protein VHC44_18775 [Verrucomicrobiae bacterium]|nr:hypothetical protein [Verrucomicrobiae bacterium]